MSYLNKYFLLIMSCFLISNTAFAIDTQASYLLPQAFETETSNYKLLVFLSEKCPCSRSHIVHVKDLMNEYPELKVFGVISEPARNTQEQKLKDDYFKKKKFGFPIIDDPKQTLVKKYQALKTPHVTLLSLQKDQSYKVVYEGGLTDSKEYSKGSKKFLEESLKALKANQEIKIKNGFCLGCHIRRF